MRALVKSRPGPGLDLLDVADPVPGRDEVVIRVEAAGVCGSDIARYAWTRNHEPGAAKDMSGDLPRILGHEYAGVVVQTGPGVPAELVGTRIAVQNILSCRACRECDAGTPNLCRVRRTLGVHRDGGYAQFAVVPEANLTPIPDEMDFHVAAAVTPFAVASNAVALADLEPGARIVIWGLGPIGVAVAMAARLRGAEVLLGIDRNPVRLAEAQALHIPVIDTTDADGGHAILEAIGPRSADAVFEAAGVAQAIGWSLPILRKRRPIVLIGNLRDRVEADLMPLVMDQQRLIGSRSYSLAVWRMALETVERTPFPRTLGDVVSLDGALAAFEAAATGTGRPFTIVPNA
jgi:threonine dehydrogenase-like Zn-dependent dehydrogenase